MEGRWKLECCLIAKSSEQTREILLHTHYSTGVIFAGIALRVIHEYSVLLYSTVLTRKKAYEFVL